MLKKLLLEKKLQLFLVCVCNKENSQGKKISCET